MIGLLIGMTMAIYSSPSRSYSSPSIRSYSSPSVRSTPSPRVSPSPRSSSPSRSISPKASASSPKTPKTSTYNGRTYNESEHYTNTSGIPIWYWFLVFNPQTHQKEYQCFDKNHHRTTCNKDNHAH